MGPKRNTKAKAFVSDQDRKDAGDLTARAYSLRPAGFALLLDNLTSYAIGKGIPFQCIKCKSGSVVGKESSAPQTSTAPKPPERKGSVKIWDRDVVKDTVVADWLQKHQSDRGNADWKQYSALISAIAAAVSRGIAQGVDPADVVSRVNAAGLDCSSIKALYPKANQVSVPNQEIGSGMTTADSQALVVHSNSMELQRPPSEVPNESSGSKRSRVESVLGKHSLDSST